MGFGSILKVMGLNSSSLWDMWFEAPELGCAMKISFEVAFPQYKHMGLRFALRTLKTFFGFLWDLFA